MEVAAEQAPLESLFFQYQQHYIAVLSQVLLLFISTDQILLRCLLPLDLILHNKIKHFNYIFSTG